ncbi:hypothetical protein FCM35_KLT11310 [Carex littledalei]|uniref:Uncharacterized protein n=1 Tax=Carex littledalei TaxID=544730 RepID=A0A833QQK0_9POAL|nr:hypothetical protein FCM35_KLT11310 [Carex littledalei]
MWEKKIYPLDKSKKKSKGMIRKQRHHAVSSNQLLVPDRRGTSSQKAHWSRLHYGSASWMLNQLTNEFDDVLEDYDNDHDMDYADGDATDDIGYVEHEIGGVETDLVEKQVYGQDFTDHGGRSDDYEVGQNQTDDLTGGVEEEAEMMGYVYVEFEREVESEDEWLLIGNM